MPSCLLGHKQVQKKKKKQTACNLFHCQVFCVCALHPEETWSLLQSSSALKARCSCGSSSSCLNNLKANFLETLSLTVDLVMLSKMQLTV